MYAVDLQVQCKDATNAKMTKINKYIRVKGKKVLRMGSWLTTAPVPRFQTLAPDWSTSPDMSGKAASIRGNSTFAVLPECTYREC
ncbi:hypothetical protein T05_7770 [Trichinella murrelli]|uniref:Uncharacterized protein n=1 Tax=Trichinella murrelli TaxID=144512 RepID=A0A0V0TDF1_9BILA|nr:hypothetical protein T05_7770 [Trichinella murrelli]